MQITESNLCTIRADKLFPFIYNLYNRKLFSRLFPIIIIFSIVTHYCNLYSKIAFAFDYFVPRHRNNNKLNAFLKMENALPVVPFCNR